MVRVVRNKLGVPSLDDRTEFEAWLKARTQPVTIGETVIAPEEAAAIADVVQREMELRAATRELGRPLDKPVVRFRDGMPVPKEWLDSKGQLDIPHSAEVNPMSMPASMPQSARDYLEMQIREFVKTKGQQNAMTDAVMALVDARAETWAAQTGLKVEDYIPLHFALGDPGDITFIAEMNRAGGERLAQRGGRSRAMAAGQADMFAAGAEDLPLFSGTAAGAAESVFRPQEVAQQGTLFDMRPEFGPSPQPSPLQGEGWGGPLFDQAMQPVAVAVTPQWKYEDYSTWSRQIAKDYTRAQIEKELGIAASKREGLAASHLRAIDATGSMGGASQRRAQSRNAMTGNYERWNAYKNALELYDVYPQHTKEGLRGLLQSGKGTKGSVQFLEDGRAVLRALTAPDVSTAAHEVGHVFLRDLMTVAQDAAAPGRMQAAADVQTTMEWLAAEAINLSNAAEGKGLTAAQRTAFGFGEGSNWIDAIDDAGNLTTSGQEIWARGFERFLADGTAPTEGLRRVFEQFKAWLGKIYSKARGRNEIDVNMSADMRQVYERLFAESEGTPSPTLPRRASLTGEGAILPVENPQLIARHELPGQLPQAMEDWARQALSDLNAGTPGQRIFDQENGGGVITSQSSTYPDWYKAMSARYGSSKQQVMAALDKIVRDHGTDTGLTVERLKELGLKELANGFEVVGARIPADPEARALLGMEITPEMERAWAGMQAEMAPTPPSPVSLRSQGREFYQSGPGEMVVETAQGPVTVTQVDGESVTVNGKKVKRVPAGDAPLPPGVLADQGARPMPIAQALDESWANNLRPIINGLQDEVRGGLRPATRTPSLTSPVSMKQTQGRGLTTVRSLPPELQAGIEAWVGEVNGKLASAKLQATKWGEYKRDSALLNYSRRYKYNTYLGMVSPYEFFTTQSMVKWALHSIDRPSVLANYYRTSKFLSTEVTKAGFPSRLGGQVQIPLPFLPEWAGGGVFVDPMKVGLPLQNWAAPWEQEQSRTQRLNYRIESTINQWMDDGQITLAEGQAALKDKGGELWAAGLDRCGGEG
ncbi:MAG: hypothetical protein IPK44_01755 [Candidatus Accumulibacter sp.]|uniref:hypothetical protein n=1 Tax=Accumulibacter sp. TaxID=2053492 RepID=UPI0025832331|nr:hypothetical protein [Accumulibacter sp.]MBK8113325.1 hypothetical protein [Accumulibacter sp.]